ncbi:MAG: hypothetical protein KAQ68_00325 [Clostridiales bacterium]|nr:hypothetical protein [Clostridiales bacterium]
MLKKLKLWQLICIIITIVIITIAIVISLIYFLPRWRVISEFKEEHGELERYEEVELNLDANFETVVTFEKKGVKILFPIDKDNEDNAVKGIDDDSSKIGNGYKLEVIRDKGKAMHKSIYLDEKRYEEYLNAKTYNEYSIKCLDIDIKDLSIFQTLDDIELNYERYYEKNSILDDDSNKYGKYQKDNYLYVFTSNYNIRRKEADKIAVRVYDTNNDYKLITYAFLFKLMFNGEEGLTFDEVSFIIRNLEISDY